jgi:hypothetical protein
MPKTTHRKPITFNTGSGNFAQKHFFNQTKWTGLNDNRNIATIDPQSFNECNNVYIDHNDVLCSRPAFQKDGVFFDDVIKIYETQQQVLEHTSAGVLRVKSSLDTTTGLYGEQIQCSLEISVIYAEGRAFIFNNNQQIWCFEDGHFTEITFDNIQNYLYLPVTTRYVDGNPQKGESPNLLTDATQKVYLAGVESYIDEDALNDQIVYYTDEDGKKREVKWVKGLTQNILLQSFTKRDFDYIAIASNQSAAIGKKDNQFFFTTNGKAWTLLPPFEGAIGNPAIAKDGATVFILQPSGLYAYSTIGGALEGDKEFPVWTNICKPFLEYLQSITTSDDLLVGNTRVFTKLLGINTIDYDNWAFVAKGNDGITSLYCCQPSFLPANGNTESKSIYLTPWNSGGTVAVDHLDTFLGQRLDASNTYSKLPVTRAIDKVDESSTVTIKLKNFQFQDNGLVALLFRATDFNDSIPTGIPNTYNIWQADNVQIPNTPVVPTTDTVNSATDKLRYVVFVISPGPRQTNGKYLAAKAILQALDDPDYFGATSTPTTQAQKNLYQQFARTKRLTFNGPDDRLMPGTGGLDTYACCGTSAPIENIGMEFLETLGDSITTSYQLKFFVPISSKKDTPETSLGCVERVILCRQGNVTPTALWPNFAITSTMAGRGIQKMYKDVRINDIQSVIRTKDSYLLGAKVDITTTDKKNNTTSRYKGYFNSETKFQGNTKLSGSDAIVSTGDANTVIVSNRGFSGSFNWSSQDMVNLMTQYLLQLRQNWGKNGATSFSDKSGVNAQGNNTYLEASTMTGKIYTVQVSPGVYKYYTITTTSFPTTEQRGSPDFTIDQGAQDIKINNGVAADDWHGVGHLYVDLYNFWNGYNFVVTEVTYRADGAWTIDQSYQIWYGAASSMQTATLPDGSNYSNILASKFESSVAYFCSNKDYDTSVLSSQFLLSDNSVGNINASGQGNGVFTNWPVGAPTLSYIESYGQVTFGTDADGNWLTSRYPNNLELSVYNKSGQLFSLSGVLDGWLENLKTIYAFKNNILYIEDRRYLNVEETVTDNKKPLIYFPQDKVEIRDKYITGLIQFTKGVTGIFHENEIWYMYPEYDSNSLLIGYKYTKGKVGLGNMPGAEIETLYDGKTICFATYRGIVGMQYEQLTQNEEQVLSYLSDNITDHYKDFFTRAPIQITQYKFWVIFWQKTQKDCLVFDIRTNSWWPMSMNTLPVNIFVYKSTLYIITENGCITPTFKGKYLDEGDNKVAWFFQSQELHFDALNYNKRIVNITLQSLEERTEEFSAILTCRNFRKRSFISDDQVIMYPVDVVRTFVQRLNYINSMEFQYRLGYDEAKAVQVPAALTATIVKFEIGEAVR